MSGIADLLRAHLDYSAWASQRLVGAAAELSDAELNRDFHSAYHSVLGTLVHVFAADRVWLSRIRGVPRTTFVSDADHHLRVLQADWPALHDEWKQWAAGITDELAYAEIGYTDLKGNPWRQPLYHLVLHAVNHATHHRGQVSAFLRALGRVPPPVDLIVYYRERLAPHAVQK